MTSALLPRDRSDTGRPLLSVVVPVYNEVQTLPRFLAAIRPVLESVTPDYEIVFAADPCTDGTVERVAEENRRDPRVKLLEMSRRFGQPAAIWAGLAYARGQAVVVIDCDLQDPPELIPEMVARWREGYKVVIPQRRSRVGETAVKKAISYLYYCVINRLARVEIPRNCGEYRLLDRRVVEELVRLRESHCFLRGLTSVVGFKTKLLPFDRKERADGVGKYNRWTGSIRIGITGLIAFSDYLLTLLVQAGIVFAGVAMFAGLALAGLKLFTDLPLSGGVAGLMVLMLFLSGVHLLGMGILGAYLGRVYDESKGRPLYVVAHSVGFESAEEAVQVDWCRLRAG